MLKENSLEYFLVYSEKADAEGRMHDREEKENFVTLGQEEHNIGGAPMSRIGGESRRG